MMEDMIREFPRQLEEAIEMTAGINIRRPELRLSNVLICGMGGSAIGGDFVRSFFRHESHIPIVCNRSYDIPAWVSEHTLVIASSYSGNTEETIEACLTSINRNAHVVALSSDGKLKGIAQEHGFDLVKMPSGNPSPRAYLGYSIVSLIRILIQLEVVNENAVEAVRAGMQLIKYDQDGIVEIARDTTNKLYDKTPVIYTPDHLEPCAVRLRQQLNENSKILCWHNVIPEMNHNELVGWKDPRPDTVIIILRSRGEHKRVAHRIDYIKEAISELTYNLCEIYAKGNSIIERSIYLIHLSDWISVFLAHKRSIDPVEIRIIEKLKAELGDL